ncbi:Glutamate racemase [Frankliniella fusca]|uniref:Glutamate racemase n=1 Tax=Frankliniella fusca TaxID=407009 RepID=A0AAE1I3H4_9NEOP|nr:Glutamate racemase [Frankliniella fusca]
MCENYLDLHNLENAHARLKLTLITVKAPVSISNGLVADASVNCDAAVKIGLAVMQSSVVGLAFPDVHIRRKDKAVNIAATNATISVGEDRLQVNPSVLFHRIICNVHTEEILEECMRYELAPRPTVLFDDVSSGQWPRPATYSTICDAHVAYVIKHYGHARGHACSVVFDGYGASPSTKNVQHIRRASIRPVRLFD